MSSRREARECSLHMLYAVDNCKIPIEDIYSSFNDYLPKSRVYRIFAVDLFRGVCEKKKDIDALIGQYSENWEIERMATVDRNIIRLAAYEIMATPATPVRVIIDEAVEISKKYSTKDSSKFVNGILDKLKVIRKTEHILREHFKNDDYFRQNRVVLEEQVSENSIIAKLLKDASKSETTYGRPDFIIQYKNNANFLIVVECKTDIESHGSARGDNCAFYAADELKLYSGYLSKNFDVLAVAVSETGKNNLKISHFLQLKDTYEAKPIFGDKLLSLKAYLEGYKKGRQKV